MEPARPRSPRHPGGHVLDLTCVGEQAGIRRWEYVPRGATIRQRQASPVAFVLGMLTSIVVAVHLVFWMIGLIE